MNIYAYVRVSARDQNERRQLDAMRVAGVPSRCVFVDKQSGKDFERPEYIRLLKLLRAGDLLYIQSIDRLGRNYEQILSQWHLLVREMSVDIAVLDMPLLDTRRGRDLMGSFLSDVVLQLLSFVAENERCNIRRRQAEGIAAARARGVSLGRPPSPLPTNFENVCLRWMCGEMTASAAARECSMPLSTFIYRARRYCDSRH